MKIILKKIIQVLNKEDSIFVEKSDGTMVNYFIFDEFEIHLNVIPRNTIQGWHAHSKIEEIILVTKGSITVESIEHNKTKSQNCIEGNIVLMNSSIHRIINSSKQNAEFAVFRFVPQEKDFKELIKNDKTEYTLDEIQNIIEGD